MIVKMELLSDTIFGNGMSVPGAEDISVLCDEKGFPYYKGTTFKGVFREQLELYLGWSGKTKVQIQDEVKRLLGVEGTEESGDKLIFSDFTLSECVKVEIEKAIGQSASDIKEVLTNLRTFTKISEDGAAQKGSLRIARCVDQGLIFYSEILCKKEDEKVVEEVLGTIKWIGSMRNRGFGKVRITVGKGENA